MIDKLLSSWRNLGALVLCRHDYGKSGLRASAVLPDEALRPAARQLLAEGYFLEDLSAAQVREGFWLTYHFDSAAVPGRVALRLLVTGARPAAPSLADLYQGAEWHEREAFDFFGVVFHGHPNLIPLLLDPEHQGPPPLRKEEKSLAPLSAFAMFGEAEVLDPAWAALIRPPKAAGEGSPA